MKTNVAKMLQKSKNSLKKDKVKPLGILKSSGFLVRHKGLEPLTFARVRAFFEHIAFSMVLPIMVEISMFKGFFILSYLLVISSCF